MLLPLSRSDDEVYKSPRIALEVHFSVKKVPNNGLFAVILESSLVEFWKISKKADLTF